MHFKNQESKKNNSTYKKIRTIKQGKIITETHTPDVSLKLEKD